MAAPASRHLVLAGGGHSHVLVLTALIEQPEPRLRLTVVSPGRYATYSGMVPGVIAGQYALRAAQIDVAALAARAGAAFVPARAVRVDPAKRTLLLDDGAALAYDLLSFDIGSRPKRIAAMDPAAPVIALRPIERAVAELDTAVTAPRADGGPGIVVVGSGAGGSEVALALAARLRERPRMITVCDPGAHPVESRGPRTAVRVERAFAEVGIDFVGGATVERVTREGVTFAGRRELPADVIIWATGAAAPDLFAASGLPVDACGHLLVDAALRCTTHSDIFAAGDCATMTAHPDLPKAGVFAVRQAPILARNLRAAARDEPLVPYQPQRRYLALLNTCDGRAIFSYGHFAYRGRSAWWLKDWIDRRFVARFNRAVGGQSVRR